MTYNRAPMRLTLRDLPREAWWLAGITLANRAGTMALPFLILYLTQRAGLAPERAGLLLAVYGSGSLVSAPVSGWLSDRVGPKRMMELSLLFAGLLLLLYPFADGFAALVALTLCWSIAADALPPASLALMSALVPAEQRKAAFALNRLAVNLGMSIGPAAGGLLATISYSWLFVVDGATSLVAAALLALAPIPEIRATHAEGGPQLESRALSDRRLRLVLFGVFAIAIVYYQTFSTLPLHFASNLAFSEATIGLLFALSTLLVVLLEVPINVRTSHWSHMRTFLLGGALIAVGFAATGLATTAAHVAGTIVVWTIGEIVLFPAFSSYIADIAPDAKRGQYMGLYLFAFNAALAVGPWLGTQVFAKLGPAALWLACLGAGLFATAALWRAARAAQG